MCACVCAGPVWSRAPRNLRAVASATRRAVQQSPPPNRLSTGVGARGHRHSSDRSSGRAGEGAGAAAGWGAALVAAPLCGMIAKAQLDPDVREWLARHGAPLSHAACEAATEPVAAGARAPVQTPRHKFSKYSNRDFYGKYTRALTFQSVCQRGRGRAGAAGGGARAAAD
jgi:hypothetical protein